MYLKVHNELCLVYYPHAGIGSFNNKNHTHSQTQWYYFGFQFSRFIYLCHSVATGKFSKGYFTFWAIIAVAWGTIGSAVIIALPLIESWETIQNVFLGMFTNDRLMEKVEEMNIKLQSIIMSIPEAERTYLMEKEKLKKKEASEYQVQSTPNLLMNS